MSEVDTGSRKENATKRGLRAFLSEVDTGSREENATKKILWQSGGQVQHLHANGRHGHDAQPV